MRAACGLGLDIDGVGMDGLDIAVGYKRQFPRYTWLDHASIGISPTVLVIARATTDGLYIVVGRRTGMAQQA